MGLWILKEMDYSDLKETTVNKRVLQHSLIKLQAEREGRMIMKVQNEVES